MISSFFAFFAFSPRFFEALTLRVRILPVFPVDTSPNSSLSSAPLSLLSGVLPASTVIVGHTYSRNASPAGTTGTASAAVGVEASSSGASTSREDAGLDSESEGFRHTDGVTGPGDGRIEQDGVCAQF